MRISDWSSDVCSSDLDQSRGEARGAHRQHLIGEIGGAVERDRRANAREPVTALALENQRREASEHRVAIGESGIVAGRAIVDRERTVAERPQRAEHGIGLRSEEHTSELQSLMRISYAVFCLKQKTQHTSN